MMQHTDWRAEQRIIRVIEIIHQNIGEEITVDDMARIAMFSKFHFTRLFQRATGVPPGRFLSAVRIHEAKRLLLTTSLSVTTICHQVGYTSVGTFSWRFKKSVGVSPTVYRELRGVAPHTADGSARSRCGASVHGWIRAPEGGDDAPQPVFVGLFPDTILQGTPVRCTVLNRPGPFRLANVPQGRWYLLARPVRPGPEEIIDGHLVAVHGPIRVRAGLAAQAMDIRLRPVRVLDPPALMALSDARPTALRAVG